MQKVGETLILSPSDLGAYLACGHLTALELQVIQGLRTRPEREDPALDLLARRGLEHEEAYLEQLRSEGLDVKEVSEPGQSDDPREAIRQRERETLEAMHSGVDVIFQATFLDERSEFSWRGHADFLRKVPLPSDLGPFSYEPVDTKLARSLRPSAVLQLCHYAEQVERLQGCPPAHVHVVLGGRERVSVPHFSVSAYYRAARDRFLNALSEDGSTYPLPVRHCEVCRWIDVCQARWEEDDHLCRVAGLTREQASKLEASGVTTLKSLGVSDEGLSVPGIGAGTLERLQRQARLQFERPPGAPPLVELLLPVQEDQGLALLPEPSPGDLFYDIEGDPHVGENGLEYLHGLGWIEDDRMFSFKAFWAHTPAEERLAFENVIDRIHEVRKQHPEMHVYHYAPYETAALGRLMGRYGTREAELDDLLRGGVFVDLYRVVRQGLVVGSESYSIKDLEPLYMEGRTGEVTDAGSSIVQYERWLQTGNEEILTNLEAYNRDDVESTWRLRDWLEDKRAEGIRDGHPVSRPTPRDEEAREKPPEVTETEDLAVRLLDGRTEPPGDAEPSELRARWLMAHLLFWHRREDKPEWWRYFERILHAGEADLLEDTEAIAGLELAGDPVPEKRSLIWPYRFDPDQEFKLDVGDTPRDPEVERRKYLGGEQIPGPGTIVDMDHERGLLRMKRGAKSAAPHPRCLIPSGPIRTNRQRSSLRRAAKSLLSHGMEDSGTGSFHHAAARRVLGNLPPQIDGVGDGQPLRRKGEDVVAAAVRLAGGLDRSTLPIQGPPGSGKTYTAARIITALVRDGRTVGITANSHAVISNLLTAVLDAAHEEGCFFRAVQKAGASDAAVEDPRVTKVGKNEQVEAAVASGDVDVVAGTAWLFSREGLADTLDTLVIDEAGQLSLANVVAVSQAARNLILVGDPQQLAQPSKGTHPDGVGVSGLEHILQERATVPDHLGLFLDRSWRMHPAIGAFISEQVYDGRLGSKENRERQRVQDGPITGGAGLRWMPVEHEGNRTSSEEEAAALAEVFSALLGRQWTNHHGDEAELTTGDILVVAPYNAQVNRIRERLPEGARVGTVDRFQGQQAPVVLVSLTASSAEDVPRGMEFLYSRNRLNVAVSRAKALSIVAGSPRLLSVQCRSVEQMRLANVLCRFVEMAETIGAGGS